MDEIICSIHGKPSAFIEIIKIIKYQLHYDFVLCLSRRDNSFFFQRLNAFTSIWDLVSETPLKPWNGFNWNFIQRNYLMCRYAKLLTFCSAASKKGDMRKVRLGDPFVSSLTVPLFISDLNNYIRLHYWHRWTISGLLWHSCYGESHIFCCFWFLVYLLQIHSDLSVVNPCVMNALLLIVTA